VGGNEGCGENERAELQLWSKRRGGKVNARRKKENNVDTGLWPAAKLLGGGDP